MDVLTLKTLLDKQPKADKASQSELIKALSTQIWIATAVLMSGIWAASANRWSLLLAGVWLTFAGLLYLASKRGT